MAEIDLSDTIIAKSDQLNASDIADSITIKITEAKKIGSPDQPVSIFYEGCNGKPWKPCKTMRRVIAMAWGSKVDMTGRRITLVCDPKVTWAGAEVGGIRITHMSDISDNKTFPVRMSKSRVEKYIVRPLLQERNKPDSSLEKEAREAALKGNSEFMEFINGLTEDERSSIRPIGKELKKIADDADDANSDMIAEAQEDPEDNVLLV